ncbi:hypothetical protein Q0F99_17970 [Rathayibacter oskolensis]|uniref:aromatic-ring hydroxylase C-terminal domain-containing protein n=1 Tax=Rathayibacter oskolensis TaxID=1891671 RepID=UPI00266036A4|nr:hypothetical protein [Rathayibacter oskolensis]WKK71313.1 hypothetical protein Q0F99_17970 [Rathayibacter oskolensis]
MPVLRDGSGEFARTYGGPGLTVHLIRPDGHVGYRSAGAVPDGLDAHLRQLFGDTSPIDRPSERNEKP